MTNVYVHPTANVENEATIGPGTRIWHRAHVRKGALIGEECVLGKDVFVDEGVLIGNHCKIQNGVSLYHGVTLDSYVFVGPHAAFTNDKHPRAFGPWQVSQTYLARGVSVGAHATIVCGVTIHPFAMIAAGAVVTRDVPAHALVAGNPARIIGYVCRHGHRMRQVPGVAGAASIVDIWRCASCNHTLNLRAEYYDESGICSACWTPGVDDLPAGRATKPGA